MNKKITASMIKVPNFTDILMTAKLLTLTIF